MRFREIPAYAGMTWVVRGNDVMGMTTDGFAVREIPAFAGMTGVVGRNDGSGR